MTTDSLKSLIHLTCIDGLGHMRIRSLMRVFKDPAYVFTSSVQELCRIDGINMKIAEKILNYKPNSFVNEQIKKGESLGVTIITFWDDEYPFLLKKIYDPPVILFIKGTFTENDIDSIAIVGTRMPTPYGRNIAQKLAEGLAKSGITIVSGFAKGVDGVAHQSALRAGGRTIAVMGSGLDIIYPDVNKKMVSLFSENGVFVSEFPFGTKPDAVNFPQRNRIISGMSHATIVVEAGNRSGALLTAFNAVDQNRDVFAVPGRLTDKNSIGCLRLIRHGAIPVHDVDQILDALKNQLRHPKRPVQKEIKLDLSREERGIYNLLSDEPKHIDDILQQTSMDPSKALTILLSMELKGSISQLSGKHFVRNI